MSRDVKLLFVAAVLGCSACAHSFVDVEAAPKGYLTPMRVIETAEARIGQKVTVVGYFTWRTDTRALWENRDAWLDAEQQRKGSKIDYWANCVTIYPSSVGARGLSDHQVRVTGKLAIVEYPDIRSLWTCNRVAIENATITAN